MEENKEIVKNLLGDDQQFLFAFNKEYILTEEELKRINQITKQKEIRNILARTPEQWGRYISCDKGWYPLLTQLEQELIQIDPYYQINQVKEKFGTLRIYASLSEQTKQKHSYPKPLKATTEEQLAKWNNKNKKWNESKKGKEQQKILNTKQKNFEQTIKKIEQLSETICEQCSASNATLKINKETYYYKTLCENCSETQYISKQAAEIYKKSFQTTANIRKKLEWKKQPIIKENTIIISFQKMFFEGQQIQTTEEIENIQLNRQIKQIFFENEKLSKHFIEKHIQTILEQKPKIYSEHSLSFLSRNAKITEQEKELLKTYTNQQTFQQWMLNKY